MRAVRSKDTTPEMVVRRLVHGLGYRYRLHRPDLPGKPDLTFPSQQKIIFVNGCFWHGHDCIRGARLPKTNVTYWTTKITRNRSRDKENLSHLRRNGWKVLIVWECATRNPRSLESRLAKFLARPRDP